MYETGDYVICKTGGVWNVTDADGQRLLLRRHGTDQEMELDADSEEIVRKMGTKEAVQEAVERIGFLRTITASGERERRAAYEAAMAEYDEIEWIKVIKTSYLRRQERGYQPYEAEYGDKARAYLHGEISAALGIPPEEVEKYIADAVSDDSW